MKDMACTIRDKMAVPQFDREQKSAFRLLVGVGGNPTNPDAAVSVVAHGAWRGLVTLIFERPWRASVIVADLTIFYHHVVNAAIGRRSDAKIAREHLGAVDVDVSRRHLDVFRTWLRRI